LGFIFGTLVLLPFIFGCDDTDCISTATNTVIVKFYDLDSLYEKTVSFDIITAMGTDSLFYDQNDLQSAFDLPANPSIDSTVFLFGNNDGSIDTLILRYRRTTRLISETCGFEQKFSALDASSTFPNVEVITNKLDRLNEQDVKVYL